MKKPFILLSSLAIIATSSCGAKEAEKPASSNETTTAEVVPEVNTFMNPDFAYLNDLIGKKSFTVEELKNAMNFPFTMNTTISGYAYSKVEGGDVTYSTQEGMIIDSPEFSDNSYKIRFSLQNTEPVTTVKKGDLIYVSGTPVISYYPDENGIQKCDVFLSGAKIVTVAAGANQVLNTLSNFDPSKSLETKNFVQVLTDFYASFLSNNPLEVTGIVKSTYNSGMKDASGAFIDGTITLQSETKNYLEFNMRMGVVPEEKVINDLIKSKKVVTLSGDYNGNASFTNCTLITQ